MFEILCAVLFCWIFLGSLKLMFKVAWGLAKIAALILFVMALPTLIGCLLYASGIILLLPVILMAIAWGILKVCV